MVYLSPPFFPAPQVTADLTADPTLPRTKDVRCPECQHNEAVYISTSTEQGMTLYFNCMSCRHNWRENV